VFWQVGSSATLGTNTVLVGSILALISDTVTTGTSVAGRVFAVTGGVTLDFNAIKAPAGARGDVDGDGKADVVWRPSNGIWFIIPSSSPNTSILQQWGTSGDIPVPGDYDGDGKTDFAVSRPSSGTWSIIPSSNPGAPIVQQWGTSGDIPVLGDLRWRWEDGFRCLSALPREARRLVSAQFP